MLAASPSPSPSTFKYSASRNGQSRPTNTSYQRSPRYTSTGTQRSPNPTSDSLSKVSSRSPALRANYRDASTQYSPMSDAVQEPPPTKKVEKPQGEETGESSTTAAASLFSPPSAHLQPNVDQQPEPSPLTKRRQLIESADTDASLTRSQASAPKRAKSAKAAAKVLPNRYELCDVEDLVILIADMISELIETNDNLPLRDVVLTRFHSRTAPGISVKDYLQRLAKHAALTPPLLLSMVYYIDRLCSLYPAFTITTLTVHRFLITAATVAAKGLSDSFWNNSTYARVGGIKLAELGMLELEFLYRVDWRIVPNPEVLVDYYHGLVGRTDDYVLESEVDKMETSQTSSTSSDEISSEDERNKEQEATDTKWNEWMKDVADSSAQKGAGNPS